MLAILSYGMAAFVVIIGGGLLGMVLGRALPDSYRDQETRGIVQTAAGMVSISTALVLGLLVATAKNKFDVSNKQTEDLAASLMLVDRNLVTYGPEAKDIIALLRSYTAAKIATSWPEEAVVEKGPNAQPDWRILESIQQGIDNLTPQTQAQRTAAASASSVTAELAKFSWLETARQANHVPQPFILVLVGWLFVLFLSFGLFAPHNAMVLSALILCALSLACAVALIVDLDRPFEGTIVVSALPMEKALLTIDSR